MVMINFAIATKYLRMMYHDEMDITTSEIVTRGNATTNVYPATPQVVNVPCRISYPDMDTPKVDNETHSEIKLNPIVICDLNVQLKARDRIALRRKDASGNVIETLKGTVTAGLPNVYQSHIEFELELVGDPS